MLKTLDDLYKMTVGQFRKHNIEYSDEPKEGLVPYHICLKGGECHTIYINDKQRWEAVEKMRKKERKRRR